MGKVKFAFLSLGRVFKNALDSARSNKRIQEQFTNAALLQLVINFITFVVANNLLKFTPLCVEWRLVIAYVTGYAPVAFMMIKSGDFPSFSMLGRWLGGAVAYMFVYVSLTKILPTESMQSTVIILIAATVIGYVGEVASEWILFKAKLLKRRK